MDVDSLALEPFGQSLLLREDVVLLKRLGREHAPERVLLPRELVAELPVAPGDFEDWVRVGGDCQRMTPPAVGVSHQRRPKAHRGIERQHH
jgi:hypothetical protein